MQHDEILLLAFLGIVLPCFGDAVCFWYLRSLGRNKHPWRLGVGESLQCVGTFERRMYRRWSQSLFSGSRGQDKRQRAPTETQEVPPELKEMLLLLRVVTALAQVARGGWGMSISGDVQKPPWHGPGQLAAGGPAWGVSGGGGPDNCPPAVTSNLSHSGTLSASSRAEALMFQPHLNFEIWG